MKLQAGSLGFAHPLLRCSLLALLKCGGWNRWARFAFAALWRHPPCQARRSATLTRTHAQVRGLARKLGLRPRLDTASSHAKDGTPTGSERIAKPGARPRWPQSCNEHRQVRSRPDCVRAPHGDRALHRGSSAAPGIERWGIKRCAGASIASSPNRRTRRQCETGSAAIPPVHGSTMRLRIA
jgi:hypothetical protein